MNLIDLILGVPLAYALYRGFTKGLILELATLAGLVIGLYAGIHFSGLAATFLKDTFHLDGKYLPLISFAGVFLLVLAGTYALGKLMEKSAKLMKLNFFNKVAGALFSLSKMALILSFLIFFVNAFAPGGHLFNKEQIGKSFLYKPVTALAPLLLPRVQRVKEITINNKLAGNELNHRNYSSMAAIPGSTLPSRYSSMAPPPVET